MTLSELRKLAQSATPGSWQDGGAHIFTSQEFKNEGPLIADFYKCTDSQANIDYITALNPSTALRMIELLERAKKEFELMCAYFEHDLQVVLHKNDIVPDAKKWLKDLEEL